MAKKLSFPADSLPVPGEFVERRIYFIRGQKVMLDSDLAELHQVTTGNLNLAVRRSIDRFPPDFMFQLTKEETSSLLLQIARAKTTGRGGRREAQSLTSQIAMSKIGRLEQVEAKLRQHGGAKRKWQVQDLLPDSQCSRAGHTGG